ncbi:hypothetical protein [Cysteiniphilum halobium]|uniref:hypothetical protein n=1 Tax=Cysteiniphilum halobium TaxID=2219059 RepID=UPI003F84F47B
MKKLFGSLNNKASDQASDSKIEDDAFDTEVSNQKKSKTPLTKQQKLMVLGGVGIACILVFQLFIISNQKEIQAHQKVLQSHIEEQAGTIRNTLSNIIHTEAEQVRKSADAKIAELKQMVLNSNTEAVTQLQQIQMKIDEVQKQTKSLDKVSDNLVKQFSAKLAQVSANNASNDKSVNMQPIITMPKTADKTATNYKIYSANSYGLVLQASNGTFTIANIGKVLPGLGEITSITANEVIAGDYRIISDPKGFKLDESAAISAYQ